MYMRGFCRKRRASPSEPVLANVGGGDDLLYLLVHLLGVGCAGEDFERSLQTVEFGLAEQNADAIFARPDDFNPPEAVRNLIEQICQ